MPWDVEYIAVEDIDIEREQETPGGLAVLPYDWCGEYNEDRSMRYINWRDAGDDDEYPRQLGQWYKVGTKIAFLTYRH